MELLELRRLLQHALHESSKGRLVLSGGYSKQEPLKTRSWTSV